MKDLNKSVISILGLVFAVVLLAFTGTQTYGLLYQVSDSYVTAAVGLVLFEVGIIYWWLVFQRDAEGLMQMGLSLLMFIICLLLVTGATALNLGAVDDFLGSSTPAKIITVAALVQLAAKLAYPLLEPEKHRHIVEKAQEGRLLRQTDKKFEGKIDEIADGLSDDLADVWTSRLRLRMETRWLQRMNPVIEGDAVDVTPEAADTPAVASITMDDLRGMIERGEIVIPAVGQPAERVNGSARKNG